AVVHMAAESHVDRSIMGPAVFVDTNVRGTLTVLEACRGELARSPRPFRFLHVSTDEVYGSLGERDPAFTEATPLAANSPYSASKAAADLLVQSYVATFDFPAIITRCSNNYGPYQFPEKLIPLMITRALAGQELPVYGDGLNVRDWLHVEDHARAIWEVLTRGRLGEVYHIGGQATRRRTGGTCRPIDAGDRAVGRRAAGPRPGRDRATGHDTVPLSQSRPGHHGHGGVGRDRSGGAARCRHQRRRVHGGGSRRVGGRGSVSREWRRGGRAGPDRARGGRAGDASQHRLRVPRHVGRAVRRGEPAEPAQ